MLMYIALKMHGGRESAWQPGKLKGENNGVAVYFRRFIYMESQMVQNSRTKIVFTLNKFFIKVKRDFNQAHQNQVTFNGFSFKVTAYFNQAQQQKLTHSANFNLTPREYCVKLKKWAFLSFKFFSVFENHSTSTLKYRTLECRNAGTHSYNETFWNVLQRKQVDQKSIKVLYNPIVRLGRRNNR